MENNELQKIWKNADLEIHQKSRVELNLLLTSITRQTLNKFLLIVGFGILSALGLIIFLTVTSLNRQDDTIYLINNITLGIIALISLVSGLMSWYKLQNKDYNLPLRDWLTVMINHLTKLVKGKSNRLYVFILPVIYALTILSIHVYYENKPFMEVLRTEESITGLIVGAPIGLFAAYVAVRKIRRQQAKNLEFLKDLHARLSSES
jgi:hypothetical protein